MDCNDQNNEFDKGLHKDTRANSMKLAIEKKKSLASTSKSSKVNDKPKGHDDEGSTSTKIHKCEFCNKEFSCGKALGGHKRFHLQVLRKENEAKLKANGNSSNCDDGKQKCHVCNKYFPSNKSLYGHMRSHPEREWRGVHPNKDKIDDNDDEQDQYFIDSSNSKELVIDDESNSWPPRSFKTDKRGRKQIFCKERVIAAKTLMHMSSSKCLHDNLDDNLDYKIKEEKVLPSTNGLFIGEETWTKLKNDDNKRTKIMVKIKGLNSTSKSKVKNHDRIQDETKEHINQNQNIQDFDLNE